MHAGTCHAWSNDVPKWIASIISKGRKDEPKFTNIGRFKAIMGHFGSHTISDMPSMLTTSTYCTVPEI